MMDTKTGDEIVRSAQSAIGQTLDTLESDVDNAFGSAKHYLRNEMQKIADNVLTRLIDYCEKQIPEAYISSHPWQMILGYLLSASKWTRQGRDAIRTR